MKQEDERSFCASGEGSATSAISAETAVPGGRPQAKKPRRKWPIAVAVVAAIVVVAGIGFWTWHEQPSFCNAICHSPMDAYVEGYYEDPTLGAGAHQAAGVTCLQCHEAKIEDQVHEGLVWLAGDFSTDENGLLTTVGVRSDEKMCTANGCHDFDEVVAATENWGGEEGVNPHDSHQGRAIDCSNCHGAHQQSIMYCNTCHDYEVPEGWATPERAGDAA